GGGGVAAVLADPQAGPIAASLVGLAMAGGVFIVPSFAAAQNWAAKERRARVVAAINVLNAAFMVAGTLLVGALQARGLSVAGAFGLIAAVCLVSALQIWRTFPGNPTLELAALRARFRLRD
ncbi:MAG TPA: hypothetical protein PLQ11_11710, partial [Beijerinckiaceae bacterium]|nr:hypothetical protein [Beijerinckiaceae bacterium]